MTLFEKIIARQIPAKIALDRDDLLAFHDINPQAPVHILIVPKRPLARLSAASEEDGEILGKLLLAAKELAASNGIAQNGYRVVINSGRDAGESVPHLHVHLLGGRPMTWPPG
jgi:histidine triad (HIT) family protein